MKQTSSLLLLWPHQASTKKSWNAEFAFLLLAVFILSSFLTPPKLTIQWNTQEKGLWLANPDMPQKSSHADSKVTILKVDPTLFNFHLVMATENGLEKKTVDTWCKEKNLVAGINAGMFHGYTNKPEWSGLVNTGYTRNYKHLNNPNFSNDKAFIAFHPKDPKLPEFQIIDKTCQDLPGLLKKYETVVQGIRVMDCKKKVVWVQDQKKWSMCLLCTDEDRNVLFVHCRSPYTVHNFMKQLLQLLPNINRAIYLEGGPESSLYLDTEKEKLSLMGSYETGFWENDNNNRLWPLPNVIGFSRK